MMRVLLAVDGSEHSRYAIEALKTCMAVEHVTLLHVVDVPRLSYQSRWLGIPDLSVIIERTLQEQGQKLLDHVLPALPISEDHVTTKIVTGHPAETIVAIASELQSDMVLMGSRGLNPLTEHVWGSVSHRVLTNAPCSTWVVKSTISSIHKMLLPIEASEDAEAVLSLLSTKPFGTQFETIVLHVVPFAHPLWLEGSLVTEEYRQELVSAGKTLTVAVASRLEAVGYQVTPQVLIGTPSHQIVQQLSALDPEIVVLSSHARRGLSRFLLGSVSHSVAHHAPHSLLLVR